MKVALCFLVLQSVAIAQTPSLADIARQERARQRSASRVATVVVTNESLGTAAAAPVLTSADRTSSDKPTDTGKPKDEA